MNLNELSQTPQGLQGHTYQCLKMEKGKWFTEGFEFKSQKRLNFRFFVGFELLTFHFRDQ